jgi:AmmeMemoRadiSam system protein B
MLPRPPAVAGLFYPGSSAELRGTVEALLERAQGQTQTQAPSTHSAKALIAPHAGYIYSGSTAALAYATLPARADAIGQVVLLGPTHRVGIHAVALPGTDCFQTPLGDVEVWQEGVQALAGLPQVATSREVHAEEHSLEVHLPFLQVVLPGKPVLPLAVGWVTPEQTAAVLDAVWGDDRTLIVVSSDLSHYHSYAEAQRLDNATIAQIMTLNGPLDHEQACGATPVNGLLLAAPAHQLTPTLLGACNSGDTAGDKRRVVGYAAFAFGAAP